MEKRGQITIFIILAIAIIGGIVLFLFIPRNVSKPDEVDSNKVYNYIRSFIEEQSYECIQKIGKQGGYYTIPYEIYVEKTAYWYYEGVNVQPLLTTIKYEIQKCIDEGLKDSTILPKNVFGEGTLKISEERIKSNIQINEQRVLLNVEYPISISKGESTSIISDFNIEYRLNLLKLYELSTGIVNYASLPEFDKCNPTNNCYDEEINFSFFNEGDNLFIKGQTFTIFENKTRRSYELKFAIKRPIKEAFGSEKKKMAVLYQEDSRLPTFGEKSKTILETNLELKEGVDFFDCEEIGNFINKINNYDVVVITGNLQFQVIKHTILDKISGEEKEEASSYPSSSEGTLLYGCNSFNDPSRKIILKNWVNNGGILWINNVEKYETDNFVVSYLGNLGYKGGKWESLGLNLGLSSLQDAILNLISERRELIKTGDLNDKDNPILTCPNDISKDIIGTWRSTDLEVTEKDDIILGTKEKAKLWIRKIGEGFVVFDEFLLKDNLFSRLDYKDDLYSKGLTEKYFVNVLNYLSKFELYQKQKLNITLISPLSEYQIEEPIFKFKSNLGDIDYAILITDVSGQTTSIILDASILNQEEGYIDKYKVNLTNTPSWGNLENQRYEWQVMALEEYSDIGSFIKNETNI